MRTWDTRSGFGRERIVTPVHSNSDRYPPLSPGGLMAYLLSTLVSVATSIGVWGTGAHSMGLLPPEAFITAANFGIVLPPMPR